MDAGDKAKCRAVCEQLIEIARASGDHEMKGNAASCATLFPGLIEDLSPAHDLLQQALQERPKDSWHRHRWARLLFRAGRFEEAAQEVRYIRERSLAMRNSPNFLFLDAMLAQQRGDPPSARRSLSLGARRVTEATEDRSQPWPALLIWQILREEAEAAIKSPAASR